jgi:protein SCO1/2
VDVVSRSVVDRGAAVFLLILLPAVVSLAACTASDEPASNAIITTTQNPGGYRGAVLDRPYRLPDVALTDTAGRPFRLRDDTRKPVTLVFFGYTSCPDVCNTVLADVAAALRRMDAGARAKVELVFITTDPARDTPRVIRGYLDRFDPSFVGLTGRLPVIEQVAAALGVPLTGITKLPGGGYEVGHGAQVIGFTSDDGGRLVWTHPTAVRDLRHDITKLTQAT